MSFLLILIFLLYLWKRGFDYYLLMSGSCFLFFYPMIFFDQITFIHQGVHFIPVYLGAKISVILGIIFLLCVGFVTKPVTVSVASYNDQVKYSSMSISFLVLLLMLIVVYDNGLGLQGREKPEVMANLGYIYKLYSIANVVLVSIAFITRNYWLFILVGVSCLFQILFGFRGGVAEVVAIFFITRAVKPGIKNLRLLFYGLLGIAILIVIKETAYLSMNLDQAIQNFVDLYDSFGFHVLSMANIESASTSLIFNLIVLNDFRISLDYLLECFIASIPFVQYLGFEPTQFDLLFKSSILGSEGDSFASGMLAVGYATASYFGIFIIFLGLAFWGYALKWVESRNNFLLSVGYIAVTANLYITFFRSDLMFLVGVIRSIVLLCLFLYLSHLILSGSSRKRLLAES